MFTDNYVQDFPTTTTSIDSGYKPKVSHECSDYVVVTHYDSTPISTYTGYVPSGFTIKVNGYLSTGYVLAGSYSCVIVNCDRKGYTTHLYSQPVVKYGRN